MKKISVLFSLYLIEALFGLVRGCEKTEQSAREQCRAAEIDLRGYLQNPNVEFLTCNSDG